MSGQFATMIADIAARCAPPDSWPSRFTVQAVEEWRALEATAGDVIAAFNLDLGDDDQSRDWPIALALFDLGLRMARVIREPAYRVDAKKAARDAELGRATMHMAQQWRHPQAACKFFAAEQGIPALILPVAAPADGRGSSYAAALSLAREGEHAFAEQIADLVALPLDGGRPMSLTGFTAAGGGFEPDAQGRLTFYGSGKAWLDAHLAGVADLCVETPGHLVERLHMPFRGPDGVLLLEPRAFEWRLTRYDCAIPYRAREIICADSRKLAELIDTEMRKREKPRPAPTVRGPRSLAQSNQERAAA